jgi:hypothetical protein
MPLFPDDWSRLIGVKPGPEEERGNLGSDGSRGAGSPPSQGKSGSRAKKGTDKLFAFRKKMSAAVSQIESRPEHTGPAYPAYGTDYPWLHHAPSQQGTYPQQYSSSPAGDSITMTEVAVTPFQVPSVHTSPGDTAANIAEERRLDDWQRARDAGESAMGELRTRVLQTATP